MDNNPDDDQLNKMCAATFIGAFKISLMSRAVGGDGESFVSIVCTLDYLKPLI